MVQRQLVQAAARTVVIMGAAGSLQGSQRRLSHSRRLSSSQRRLSSQHTMYSPEEAAMFSPSASGPCQQVIRKVIAHRLQAAEKQGDVLAGALAALTDDLTAALLAAAPHVVAAFGEEAAIGAATGAYAAPPTLVDTGAGGGAHDDLPAMLNVGEDEAAALAARTRTQIAARREDAHWKAHEADEAEKRKQAEGKRGDGCGGPGHEQEQPPVQIASETPAMAASSTAKLTSSVVGAAAGTDSPQTATRDSSTNGDLIQKREKVLVSSETQPGLVAAAVAQQPETTAERKARKMALRYHDSSGSASEGGSFRGSASVSALGVGSSNDVEPAGGEIVSLDKGNMAASALTPEQQRKSRRMSARYLV